MIKSRAVNQGRNITTFEAFTAGATAGSVSMSVYLVENTCLNWFPAVECSPSVSNGGLAPLTLLVGVVGL